MRSLSCLILLPALLCAAGNPPTGEEVPAGHSYHGEVFNEGPRQGAWLMGNTGDVHFPITTASAEVQEFFDQGVGQLHGFWYLEAERSFRHIAALQPGCAMAYWGMAMANVNNDRRARDFIDEARARMEGVSERERMWIESLHRYHHGEEKDDKRRSRRFIRDLESLIDRWPEDPEPRAFLAWAAWNYRRQHPIGSHQAVSSLIGEVLDTNSMHPAHHYRIHLWDRERPDRALASAALCGQSAPGIAHMWHMPGHIYSGLHRYADAAWQQEASARVDHAHMMRARLLPDRIFNFSHNNEWLIRNLNHLGRARDAIDLARNMIELPRHPRYNTVSRRTSSSAYGRRRLMETLVRYELWEELLRLADTVLLEPSGVESDIIQRQNSLGLAAWQLGDADRLRSGRESLEELLARKRRERLEAADEAERKAVADDQAEDKVAEAMVSAMRRFSRSITDLRAALARMDLYLALLEDRPEEARRHLGKTRGLPADQRARIHLALGEEEKAVEIIGKAVESSPGQVRVHAAAVEILHRAGRDEEAREMFGRLQDTASHLDDDLPVTLRLDRIASDLSIPVPWKRPFQVPDDTGIRPDLDSLGPFRWSPWQAPGWSLDSLHDGPVSLADYRGRPVLLVFYLGYGCAHCVEQLAAIVPRAGEFENRDIAIVAISTESRAELEKAYKESRLLEDIPFPILANPSLDIFRSYRAFDDFEDVPLHGTFLIDGTGAVRWQDIGYEPFTDVDFILEESRRLLSQPTVHLASDSILQRDVGESAPLSP